MKKSLQAEIIAIGDEILIGQTIDTNSSFIATQLNAAGVRVVHKQVVEDSQESIVQALDTLRKDTSLVFITGGLGPTKDDITKTTLLDYFGGELIYHQEIYDNVERLFLGFNRTPSEINKQQAFLPSSCSYFINEIGTASAMHFERDNRHYFSLPGVPYETEYLVEKKIIPWIEKNLRAGKTVHKTLLTQGVPESELATIIADWEDNLPDSLSLAYLPSAGLVKLRLSSYDLEQSVGTELIDAEFHKLNLILGDIVFGNDAETLEEVIGILLKENGLTIGTAESCTGGYIAHLLTSVPGSSAYFQGSVISYSNDIKIQELDVKEESLKSFGAVSEKVVTEMANGLRKKFNLDFAVATSGIAGPDGGSLEKPIGTIWIAVAGPKGTKAHVYQFGRNRQRNIRKTALMALDFLRKEIQKNSSIDL